MIGQTLQDLVATELQRISGGGPVSATLDGGVVTLSGVVKDEARRILIEQELLALPGVTDVRNHLHVPLPGGPPAEQLRSLFEKAKIDASAIEASVATGVVTLRGKAATWFDRDAAERLAWMLPGVHSVDNRIGLPPEAFDPTDEAPAADIV
jgi:hypothetical protein